MKYRIFRLKVGRWRLVLANCRLKKMNPSMAYRSKTLCKAVANTKRRRYKQNGGCCDLCGKHIHIDDAEMHHILPFSEFPQYGMNPSNLELVCDECHHSIGIHTSTCSAWNRRPMNWDSTCRSIIKENLKTR